MPLIEISILELILSIIALTGTLVFSVACTKRKELRPWLLIYLTIAIGYLLNYLRIFFPILEEISYIIFGLAVCLVSLTSIILFYRTFIKKTNLFRSNLHFFIVLSGMELFFFVLVNLMWILLVLSLIMLIQIYFKQRNLTLLFICFSIIAAILSAIGNLLILLNIGGGQEINIGADIFFTALLIATGIVANLENTIRRTEIKYKEAFNRASFYKDLFAHDMNNILQNMRSSSELLSLFLKEDRKSEEVEEMANLIREQVNRGASLISNVRTLSNIEESPLELKKVEACKIVHKALECTQSNFPKRNINIRIESSFNECSLKANEFLLDVFENILINAVKHNKNQEIEIILRVTRYNGGEIPFFKFEFIDNGVGIPNDMKQKIFNRTNGKSRNEHGMGLGLSLVKQIIKKYGGDIWVEDRIVNDFSKGSNFIILIPEAIN